MIILNDGRSKLYQWDTNVYVFAEGYTQVHFSNILTDDSFPVDVIDGVARIPDELLQVASSLNVWGYIGTAEDGYTKTYTSFPVIEKSKPLDYVFTPTEQLTIQDILDKLDTLKGEKGEKGDSGVYVGSGEMPEGYIIQVDLDALPTIDMEYNPESEKPQSGRAVAQAMQSATINFVNVTEEGL